MHRTAAVYDVDINPPLLRMLKRLEGALWCEEKQISKHWMMMLCDQIAPGNGARKGVFERLVASKCDAVCMNGYHGVNSIDSGWSITCPS